jgi:hypothetical protein
MSRWKADHGEDAEARGQGGEATPLRGGGRDQSHSFTLTCDWSIIIMIASARWIAVRAVSCLSEAVERLPDYGIKVLQRSVSTEES